MRAPLDEYHDESFDWSGAASAVAVFRAADDSLVAEVHPPMGAAALSRLMTAARSRGIRAIWVRGDLVSRDVYGFQQRHGYARLQATARSPRLTPPGQRSLSSRSSRSPAFRVSGATIDRHRRHIASSDSSSSSMCRVGSSSSTSFAMLTHHEPGFTMLACRVPCRMSTCGWSTASWFP
jgi:hypothetical protein